MRAVLTALPVVTHLTAFRALSTSQRGAESVTTCLKPIARFMGVFVNRIITSGAATAFAMIAFLSCTKSTDGPSGLNPDDLSIDAARVVASIQVSLASSSIKVGQKTQATAAMTDRQDRPIDRVANWSSSNTTIATVDDSGLVTAKAPGKSMIVARRNQVSGSAQLTVTADSTVVVPAPVASVTVALASSSLNPGQTTQATATTKDSSGKVLTGRAVTWSSNNGPVATVSSAGLVTAVASGSASIVATSEGKSGNAALTVQAAPPPPPPPPGATLLFQEDFENASMASRGWYDNTNVQLSTTEHVAGSTASAQYHFLKGAAGPTSGSAQRHKFTPTNSLYISYNVKYSTNWVGSGQDYHPHEFYVLSTLDGQYDGPGANVLTLYVEQNYLNGGRPRLAVQDNKSINTSMGSLPNNLIAQTENRSTAGCNGISEPNMVSECYQSGGAWYNDKTLTGPVAFQPNPGPGYKNNWNFVEAYFQLNTVSGGKGQADGVMQYWFNGVLVIDRHDIMFRTAQHPTLQLNQFLIAPYIGDGSPVDQSMWVDNLRTATARIP